MKIFSFKEAIPIILPVIYFKDKYNDINNYSELPVYSGIIKGSLQTTCQKSNSCQTL